MYNNSNQAFHNGFVKQARAQGFTNNQIIKLANGLRPSDIGRAALNLGSAGFKGVTSPMRGAYGAGQQALQGIANDTPIKQIAGNASQAFTQPFKNVANSVAHPIEYGRPRGGSGGGGGAPGQAAANTGRPEPLGTPVPWQVNADGSPLRQSGGGAAPGQAIQAPGQAIQGPGPALGQAPQGGAAGGNPFGGNVSMGMGGMSAQPAQPQPFHSQNLQDGSSQFNPTSLGINGAAQTGPQATPQAPPPGMPPAPAGPQQGPPQAGPDNAFLTKTMGSYDPNSSRDRAKADQIRKIYQPGMTSNQVYANEGYSSLR